MENFTKSNIHCPQLAEASKNLAAECWSDFRSEKFYFEIFSKTNVVSITSGPK